MNRLTFAPAFEEHPVWSPKGDQIAFRSTRNGTDNIYVKATSGSGDEQLLINAYFAWDWPVDGRFIVYGPQDGRELSVMPLFGDRKPFTYLPRSQSTKVFAQLSSDARWIAYSSNESGMSQPEVYIQPFPNPSGKWQISPNGGFAARWRHDGKEIFYIAPDGKLMAVPLRSAGVAWRSQDLSVYSKSN